VVEHGDDDCIAPPSPAYAVKCSIADEMHIPRGRWVVDMEAIRSETIGKSCNGRGIVGDVDTLLLIAPEAPVLVDMSESPSVFFNVATGTSSFEAVDAAAGTNLIHSTQHSKCTAWKKMSDVVGCERIVTTRGAPTDTVSRRLGRSAHRVDEGDDAGIAPFIVLFTDKAGV